MRNAKWMPLYIEFACWQLLLPGAVGFSAGLRLIWPRVFEEFQPVAQQPFQWHRSEKYRHLDEKFGFREKPVRSLRRRFRCRIFIGWALDNSGLPDDSWK
jgi:hypothetical protein